MTLALTQEQKNYLNKRGPLKARELERVFEQSVKDQEAIKRQAEEIRLKQKKIN